MALKPEASPKQNTTVTSSSIKGIEQKSSKATSTSHKDTKPDKELREPKINEKKPTTKPANLNREKSDIFKSFSKTKAKLKKEDTDSSTGASPAPAALDSVSFQGFPRHIFTEPQ